MFKYIKSGKQKIYCMAFPRKVALKKLESLSDEINEHIIKCVIYKEIRYLTVSHWVGELATWMNAANKVECDTKLKPTDYLEKLFVQSGNSRVDAEVNLLSFKATNQKQPIGKQYPDFEVTDNMIDALFSAYNKMKEVCIPLLLQKGILTATDWKDLLMPIFK